MMGCCECLANVLCHFTEGASTSRVLMASMMVGIMKDWWRARGWLISGRIHVCWTCADRQSHAYCIVSSPTYQDKVHQRVQFIQHCVHGLPAPLRDTWERQLWTPSSPTPPEYPDPRMQPPG